MKRHLRFGVLLLSFALSISLALAAHADNAQALGPEDIDALRTDVRAMTEAFEQGDADAIAARTHPSLKAMAGGPEAFAAITRAAVTQLRGAGVAFVSLEIGTPTRLYPAGEEEVCFVPRISVMEMQRRRMKSTSYLVAIRQRGGGPWTYLDGTGLRKRPEMLHQLLPALEPGIALPPNMLE